MMLEKQEYNMIILPADLETGDYVDVRITFPVRNRLYSSI